MNSAQPTADHPSVSHIVAYARVIANNITTASHRAGTLVEILDRAIMHKDRDLGSKALAYTLAIAHAADPGGQLNEADYARVLAQALAEARALDRILTSADALTRAHLDALTLALDANSDSALELARVHAVKLGRACALACKRVKRLAHENVIVRGLTLTNVIAAQIATCEQGIADQIRALERSGGFALRLGMQQGLRVSGIATRALDIAVGALPPDMQARYQEEYNVELYELAHISRTAQLRYAANLLISAWPLRRELRRTDPDPAPSRQPR